MQRKKNEIFIKKNFKFFLKIKKLTNHQKTELVYNLFMYLYFIFHISHRVVTLIYFFFN